MLSQMSLSLYILKHGHSQYVTASGIHQGAVTDSLTEHEEQYIYIYIYIYIFVFPRTYINTV